ncbi:exopolysaccharide Pel transporter PelG, partial [bacterium]|nr:exopolysaccharide Pel transporter PelG [bacterium]
MAGIGFRLRRLFDYDTYIDNLRGIAISSSIAGGPIFFSILCLILLGVYSTTFLSTGEMSVFLVTVVYIFAFSLISTGIIQLLITRYLADLIYTHDTQWILPTFTGVLAVTVAFQLMIGLPFLFFWDMPLTYKCTALMMFITIGCIWQLMIFLSAVRNYRIIVIAFVLGLSISFGGALYLGNQFGLTGFLHGYTIGHIVLLFILLARIFSEFKTLEEPSFNFIPFIRQMPQLVVVGLCYNAGIWIDKIIFWFGPEGERIGSLLFAFRDYDGATFFAYLTLVPSYTYFLVKVETDFYGYFRAFFHSILDKRPLKHIFSQRQDIANSVKESLFGLIKLQGTITLICLFFSDEIISTFRLPIMGTLILEKALIAAFLQMVLLTIMIFMMYFDIRKQLMAVSVVFLLSNLVLTLLTLHLGYVFYGYGYLLACLITLIVAYVLLSRHISDLEYHTF